MFSCWCGRRSAIIDSGIGLHLGFYFWCIWHVSQFCVICWISAFMVVQYQNCFARLYDLSDPVWYWCSRSWVLFFLVLVWLLSGCCGLLLLHILFLWLIFYPHTVEYSRARFVVGICFGFLYALIAFISSLHSWSMFLLLVLLLLLRGQVLHYPMLLWLLFLPVLGVILLAL